jgi:PAS domain S-box-containing protein
MDFTASFPPHMPRRTRWAVLLSGLLLLVLAHGAALSYRVQPAVSLWFPPSGVAIALTLWFGPIGAVLTWIVSFFMSPLWGNDGWAQLASITDATEPLVAWFLYCSCFRGSLTFRSLRDASAFMISAPLAACGASAVLGSLALVGFGKLSLTNLGQIIPHWWLGNALGTMAIAPALLLLLTPLFHRWGWLQLAAEDLRSLRSIYSAFRHHRGEILLVLLAVVTTATVSVQAAKDSIFTALQFSLLSAIPIIWAASRFGVRGGVCTASFSVLVTLLDYLVLYPNAILLPRFPVEPELLHTHKLSLLLQGAIALLVGTAVTERAATQVALAVEQVRSTEYQARAELSEQLLKLNQSLSEANQQLQSSENRYRDLAEAMPQMVWTADASGSITYFNQRWYDYTGKSVAESMHVSGSEAVHPDDRAHTLHHWQRAVAAGEVLEIEYRIRRTDGVYRWFICRGLPIRDSQGQVASWVGTITDIDDQKRIEAELRQQQERFDLAQTAAKIGSFEWNIQTNVNIWSKELEALYGLQPGEFGGTYEAWSSLVHPEDLARAEAETRQALESGEFSTDWRVIWREGSIHWLHARARVFYDEAGKPLRMLGINVDITDRKQANAQNQLLASLAENSTDFIGIATLAGKPLFVNPAGQALVGLNPQTTEQVETILEFFAPADQEYVQQTILPTVMQQGHWQGEFHFRHFVTGDRIPVFYNLFAVKDAKTGAAIALATVTRDFRAQQRIETERSALLVREQEARQQAEAASRMKDEFLAVVSHELRSPLNGILGWSRLLRTRKLDPDKTEQALASIERNAQAQTQLIEDLLDISRIIRGKVRLTLRPLSLVPVIQAALDTVRPTASTKSIQIETQLDASAGLVLGDADRLQQVVWNLLSNAVKFTPDHGQVTVRLAQVESRVHLQVTDTGQGIEPDFLPHVFDRFRQADATTTRTQGGLGLGLAIVRNLVELHGGKVSAESAGSGQGATFSVELPLLLNADSPPATASAPSPNLPITADSLAGVRVLVVDDEADTRDFMVTTLEQFGAVVTAAVSVSEALEHFQQHRPDVLLSDIGMPTADGYALIRQIRSLPPEAGGQVPAAALTAYVRGDDRLQALAAGFQLHVPKPIEPIRLLHVVAQLAGRATRQARSETP